MIETKAHGTTGICATCGKEFVRKRVGALNCGIDYSKAYSTRMCKKEPVSLTDADRSMTEAWHYAISKMPASC